MIPERERLVIVKLLETAQERLIEHEDDDEGGRVTDAILSLEECLDAARKITGNDPDYAPKGRIH